MEEQEINLIDIADDLLILNKHTIDKLFELDNAADCIALYMLYYKTAKWQKTNQPKATDDYVRKCLKWGRTTLRNAKDALLNNGLIEIIQRRKGNKISGWFVKVSYLISAQKIEDYKIKVTSEPNDNNTQAEQVPKWTYSTEPTNTLKLNNKYLKTENKILKDKNIYSEEVKTIIDYLNEKAKKNFRETSKGTVNIIIAKLKEGYSVEDFKNVIDKKVNKWLNDEKMNEYLRPSTLFGNKFESYLNERAYFTNNTVKSSYSSVDNTANHEAGNPKISDTDFNEFNFKGKKDYVSHMDLADMTKDQREFFDKYCLARDENGNLIKF